MNLVVTLDHRFHQTPDSAAWTSASFTYGFWTRYLDVFDHVRIVARARLVESVSESWQRSDGRGVSLSSVPYYVGPQQYLWRVGRVTRAARRSVDQDDAVILRVPSRISSCVASWLHRASRPYGVEVVGDPYDVFSRGAMKHPLRPFLRWWSCRQLREQCSKACAAAYVTEHALQQRYPPAAGALSTHYSSVVMADSHLAPSARLPRPGQRRFALVTVGTLAQLYKGPDVLIEAVADCVGDGLDLELIVVGDGRLRSSLEAQVRAEGLENRIHFTGQLPAGEAVRAQLDRADVFVLPSRQEGLPRAMIEAMARGLPAIGSTAGGIPELLPSEDMVPVGDVTALSSKIREVVTDPERMARMSARNLEEAQGYCESVLRQRRTAFYRHVREGTEEWLQSRR